MKMASQRFCLRWNNHQSNLLSVFDQLLHAETFTDVTLAVDGQYLKAHKMVLSACSPYFNALFVNHPEKHPIVILKDVPYSDMKSLLDFMYRGEVSVDQERLTAFLRVAESLRIKGLTEVNDDKPTTAEPTVPPPQLQRIQPFLVQQQQQQQQQQQRKTNMLTPTGAAANVAQVHAQQSLLSTALASMPKRKRGRPRKLSGSSNGTGNDYDEYERDGMLNDSDLGNGKLGHDSYSGNDDGSDDNQQDSGNNDDLNESHESIPSKKSKSSKDNRAQHQEDNSTSVQKETNMPELTQAIFAITTTKLPTSTNITTTPMKQKKINALTQQQELEQQQKTEHQQPQPQLLSPTQHVRNELAEKIGTSMNLPSVYGLKIRAINTAAPQQHQQQQQMSHVVANNNNSNSLLKQQLRAGLKDIDIAKVDNATNMDSNKTQQFGESSNSNNNVNDSGNGKFSNDTNKNNNVSNCCALQSLANVAERQMPNVIQQSTNVNSLHHQLLLHMAAQTNPLLKTSADFFQLQQQQQQQQQPQLSVAALAASTPTQSTAHCIDDDMDLLIEPNDKYEPEHDLTLADENAGFEYRQCSEMENDQQQQMQQTIGAIAVKTTTSSSRPVQRRRVRRKAQSTNDDQAEHLTEMSVRGLDLFRYASISEGVYQCTECAKENMQKTFKNKYSFQRHAFLYHEGKHRKVFPCPVCSKEFSRPDKMKNHMKMTHENFLATTKDISNFNPLNYLITATATGDIQATLYQQQQQQQQQNQSSYDLQRAANEHQFQLEQNIKKLEHHQHQQQQQQQQQQQPHSSQQVQQQQLENNAILLDREVKQEIETSPTVENSPLSPPDATVSMLKMENNIIVKNELVISPSPTPPPFSLATTDGSQSSGSGATGNITLTATAQTAT